MTYLFINFCLFFFPDYTKETKSNNNTTEKCFQEPKNIRNAIMMESGFDDDPPAEPRDGWLLVRIHVPELNVYKCLQFPSDRLVWDVKQQVLASLPKVRFLNFCLNIICCDACQK